MQVTIGRVLLAGTAAGIVAAVVNAVIYATGVIDQSIETPAGGPITLGAVAAFSVIPNIVGAAVFWLLRSTTPPLRLWRIVVIGVTIASIVTPFGLQDAPTGMLAGLLVMHVVAGLAALLITPAVATTRASTSG